MNEKEVELDKLRIWDFYLTFPNEARKISYPKDLSSLKKIFKPKPPNPYEDLIDPKRIIDRMKEYQISALRCLASYGFIDSKELSKNIVRKTDKKIPPELSKQINSLTTEKLNVIKLLIGFKDLPLYGEIGLKSRTGLLEFKYDPK